MMKKIAKFLVCILCFLALANTAFGSATTLKDLKDQLNKDISNKDALIARQREIQSKINKVSGDIEAISKEIEDSQRGIEEAKVKIVELNEEIVEKNKEIESLISFKQVSEGDNIYIEYIFGASTFTDFIYRSALVEQLTAYNDNLIDEMYNLIEENEKLQIDLKKKIEESEAESKKLENALTQYDLTMDDLSEDQTDIEADIKARKAEVGYYEEQYAKNGCSETTDIYTCIGVPYANGFTRPLDKASVTSEFGMRYHPTLHYYRMHNGIDLGVAMGSKVYASAAGVVSKITYKSSCGGNIIWIQHNVDGTRYRTVYQHLASMYVSVGDVVTMTTVIGTSGGGGYTLKSNGGWDTCSTGAHLHFGIMTGWTDSTYVNPRNYISFPSKGKSFYSRF